MTSCPQSFKATPWQSPWILMILAIYAFALPWIVLAIVMRYWVNRDYNGTLVGIDKTLARRVFMVAHMTLGAISMLLGPTQFLPVVRRKAPKFHRWSGRIYVASAVLCSICGFVFIGLKGFVLVGGINMGVAFSAAGFSFGFCAVQTARKARNQEFTSHRNWAIRAYSQVLSPMMYRYFYGILVGLGLYASSDEECNENDVCPTFTRTFDEVHAWTYFLFPLFFAELIIWFLPKDSQVLASGLEGRQKDKPNAGEDPQLIELGSRKEDKGTSNQDHDGEFNYMGLNCLGIIGAASCVACTTLIYATSFES